MIIVKEARSRRLVVPLDEDDSHALNQEMERNGYATKAGLVRNLIRGMHTEIHPLGTVHSDLRIPSVFVELVDRLEYHRKKCGEGCPHAMQEYRFVMDRYRVTYVQKSAQESSSQAVRIAYSPSGRREEK